MIRALHGVQSDEKVLTTSIFPGVFYVIIISIHIPCHCIILLHLLLNSHVKWLSCIYLSLDVPSKWLTNNKENSSLQSPCPPPISYPLQASAATRFFSNFVHGRRDQLRQKCDLMPEHLQRHIISYLGDQMEPNSSPRRILPAWAIIWYPISADWTCGASAVLILLPKTQRFP